MNVIFCTCCETIIQDVRANTISLINLIDELQAIAFPVAIPKLSVISLVTREEGESDPNLRLRATLNDTMVFEMEFRVEFQDKLKTRAIGEFQGILLSGPGMLRVAFYDRDDEIAGWDILVRAVGAPRADLFSVPSG